MANCYLTVSAFLIYAMNSGTSWPFGVILPELVKGLQCTTAEAAVAGAIQQGFLLGSAVFVGGLVDLLDCHRMSIIGSVLCVLGLVLNFFVTNVYELYVTNGVLAGLGMGLQFIPVPVAVHRQVPESRRTLVMGIVVSGGGIGTFAYAPLCRLLMNEYGWRWMYLILAGLMLNAIPLSMALKTPAKRNTPRRCENNTQNDLGQGDVYPLAGPDDQLPTKPKTRTNCLALKRYLSTIFDFSLLKVPPFQYLLCSIFLLALGIQVPFFFLPSKAGEVGLSPFQASWLVAAIGLTDTVGRAAIGAAGTWLSAVFLLMIGDICLGILHIASYFFNAFPSLMVYSLLFGFLFGNHVTMYMTSGPELLGVERAAKSIGISFTVVAMAICTTPSLGAYLWKVTDDPGVPFLYSGCTSLAAGAVLALCLLRYSDRITVRKSRLKPSDARYINGDINATSSGTDSGTIL